ncbi:MAG: SusC/RagA family TonB-linked outer membrane protein, partial [Gemmatimonadetes bacterium]|nr:SusC/RagA family TonB-linked outer membrane protein [Gemmatimonadota bacterium]
EGTVRGTVTEAGSRRPLSGAQVAVVGTGLAAVTDAAGRYTLVNVPSGNRRVRASLLGFSAAERAVVVAPSTPAEADFALSAAAVALDEIVVTGTAGAVSRRTVGNAISTINVAEVSHVVANNSVTELLQAKVPGMSVSASSGAPGTAGNIRIRGVTSLAANSAPVVYVDGVRVYSGHAGNFKNSYQQPSQDQSVTAGGGGQAVSALDAINPEDIESIEVIKGPAASTLYGADAANGVIQIITKKGKPGEQKLEWNARVQAGSSDWALARPANYTTCDAAHQAAAAEWFGCTSVPTGTVLTENFLDQVLQTGGLTGYSLSVRGGGQGYSFFAALDDTGEDGVFSNSTSDRTGARGNFTFYPTDRVDFSVNLGYTRSRTNIPLLDNSSGAVQGALMYQPGRTPLPGRVYGLGNTPAELARYENSLSGDRIILGTTLNFRPADWFRNRLVIGGDLNAGRAVRYVPRNDIGLLPTGGQVTEGSPRQTVYSLDYAGTVERALTGSLTSALSFGAQYTTTTYRNAIAQGTNFEVGKASTVSQADVLRGWDEFNQTRSLGFFGQEQLGWSDRLFVTGALRVDNSSVFGQNIKQLYYPKLSVSYVATEGPVFRGRSWLDELKLRAAWGQAGNAPGSVARETYYIMATGVDASGQEIRYPALAQIGNPDIRPERGSEFEAGFDAAFLGNRLGIEFTAYDKTTRDALIPVPIPVSEVGIPNYSQLQNVGRISNRGLELGLTGTPLQGRALTWDTRLSLSTNRNRIADLGIAQDTIRFGAGPTGSVSQLHVVGHPLGAFFVRDPVLGADGQYTAGPVRYLGPSLPTREASLSNTFTVLGNLRLFTLVDYKGGNYLLNATEYWRCSQAAVCEEMNDPSVPAERKKLLTSVALKDADALYTQRADFVKLRDVSLTYTVPSTLARRFRTDRMALTLAGHNLGFLWKGEYTGLDPEVSFAGLDQPGADYAWVRQDFFTMPMLRRITASIDVSF